MPARATNGNKAATAKVEVVLPNATAKKHSTRFETEEAHVEVTNIYLSLDGMRKLGNPRAVKITVEAHELDS